MGLDFKLVDSFIHHPVFILKPPVFIAGFLRPVGAGVKVVASLALRIGDKCTDLLGAGFVGVDGDVPALHRFAGIGHFVKPNQALFLVVPGIHSVFPGLHSRIMEAQLRRPVIVLRGQLYHGVPS